MMQKKWMVRIPLNPVERSWGCSPAGRPGLQLAAAPVPQQALNLKRWTLLRMKWRRRTAAVGLVVRWPLPANKWLKGASSLQWREASLLSFWMQSPNIWSGNWNGNGLGWGWRPRELLVQLSVTFLVPEGYSIPEPAVFIQIPCTILQLLLNPVILSVPVNYYIDFLYSSFLWSKDVCHVIHSTDLLMLQLLSSFNADLHILISIYQQTSKKFSKTKNVLSWLHNCINKDKQSCVSAWPIAMSYGKCDLLVTLGPGVESPADAGGDEVPSSIWKVSTVVVSIIVSSINKWRISNWSLTQT